MKSLIIKFTAEGEEQKMEYPEEFRPLPQYLPTSRTYAKLEGKEFEYLVCVHN